MFGMLFTDVTDLATSDSQAAITIATGDLVSVTFALVLVTSALVVAGCVIGVLQIRVVLPRHRQDDGRPARSVTSVTRRP